MRRSPSPVCALLVVAVSNLFAGVAPALCQSAPPPTTTLASSPPTSQPTSSPAGPTASPSPPRASQSPSPSPSATRNGDSGPDNPVHYSLESVTIAGFLILVLGLVFYWQLRYAHVLEQTSYLGGVFRESVLNFEINRFAAPHREKWVNGEYHQEALAEFPPIELPDELRVLDERFGGGQLALQRRRDMNSFDDPWAPGTNRRPGGTSLPTGGLGGLEAASDSVQTLNDYNSRKKEYLDKRDTWVRKIHDTAKARYNEDLARQRKEAEKRTDEAVGSTDVAVLRGRGPQFVLEFTALIVILFLAVVLGVLGRLSEQQIGTLLAAIAGYVLGRATAGRSEGQAPPKV